MYQSQWQQNVSGPSSGSWAEGGGEPSHATNYSQQQLQRLDHQQSTAEFADPGSQQAAISMGSNNTLSGAFGGLGTPPASFNDDDPGMLRLSNAYQSAPAAQGHLVRQSSGGAGPTQPEYPGNNPRPYGYSQDIAVMGMSEDSQLPQDTSAFAAFSQPSLDIDEFGDAGSSRQTLLGSSSNGGPQHPGPNNHTSAHVQAQAAIYGGSGSATFYQQQQQRQQSGQFEDGAYYADQGQHTSLSHGNDGQQWHGHTQSALSGNDDPQQSASSILQRPNKPSALNLDKSQSAFESTFGHASTEGNGYGGANIGYEHGADSYAEMPQSAVSQGSMLTPQNAKFVSVPQLPPSLFEQMSSAQPSGDQSGPGVLMPAFGSEPMDSHSASTDSHVGFTYGNPAQFASGSGSNSSSASGSGAFLVKHEDDGATMQLGRPAMARLEIPPSPGSPLHAQLTGQFSPSSTLSGAFSSRPNSRPSSQGLKSVASFTSSLGTESGFVDTSGRPRSGSSGHIISRPTMALSRTISMNNESSFMSPGSGPAGSLPHSRSVQNLGSPVQGVTSHMGQNFDPTWGAAGRQLATFQGIAGHQHPFQSPGATASPAQSQYSPQAYFGQQPSGVPFYSPSIESSQRFGSNGSLGSDNLDVAGFNEQRLSAALANSAQISGGGDGHSTPTIMEEEEDGTLAERELSKPEAQLRSAPSQSQLANLQLAHHQHQQQQQQALLHRSRSGPIGSPNHDSSPFQQQMPFQPNMRPSLYQQLSLTELNQLRQMHGVSAGEQNIGDCSSFIQDIIRQYITTMSRLGLGERNVLIMTTKVAQKSYGAEKRFLCPPPMVLLIGSSWWNVCPDASRPPPFQIPGRNERDQVPTVLSPPRLTINISGEPGIQDGALEWASNSGKLIDVGNPSSEMAISGRCIGKQLYISDVDEKRRHVEALVSISVPGASPMDRRLLGTFASKPIKVISKPSKKRQSSRNTELCVNHGSVISLFHRLRSQTVSTRYLCVSGAPSWFKGSDNQPFLNMNPREIKGQETPSCFVAKMSSWDPFIIYLVDPKMRADTAPSLSAPQPPVKGYPPPPPNALPTSGMTSSQMTVHYNQPIVLQCLNTAVVSPVMVIRKVEKGTTVLGGGSAGGPHFSREAFGDPVSQLHKIALEALEDPSAAVPRPVGDAGENLSPGQGGPFLACLNESVGMHRPSDPRKWISNNFSVPSTPTTPITPMNLATAEAEAAKHLSAYPTSPTSMAAAYAAAQTRYSMTGGRGSFLSPGSSSTASGPSSATAAVLDPAASNDGGKVKRPRRVSSSVVMQKERAASASKNRKRGQSLSVVGMQNQAQENDLIRRTTSYSSSMTASDSSAAGSVAPGAMWSVEVGDSDIWTIVGTDIARHSFYVPPRIIGGSQPTAPVADSSISHLITVPAPSQPITPIPLLYNVVPPPPRQGSQGPAPPSEQSPGMVTLFGENFHPNLFVYFGDWKSEHVEVRSRGTIVCSAPPSLESGVPRGQVPILLVRHDGIIFPTDLHYQC